MSYLGELEQMCDCCMHCQQQRPCDGLQAGGLCDDLCDCAGDEYDEADIYWDEDDS